MELIAVVQLDVLHAVESPHKVEVPIAAPELTVGDKVQSVCFLLGDEVGDKPILYVAEVLGGNLPLRLLTLRDEENFPLHLPSIVCSFFVYFVIVVDVLIADDILCCQLCCGRPRGRSCKSFDCHPCNLTGAVLPLL